MPQAKRKTTTRPAPAKPAITNIDPAGLPDHYGMRVLGDCMMPEIADNDLLHFDKHEPVKAGDTVVIYLRPELEPAGQMQAGVKRLVTNIPPWVKSFPYQDHPNSNVHALIIAEMLNPPRQFTVKCSHVLAVHKCMGHLPLEQRAPGPNIPAPKLKQQRTGRRRGQR